MHATDVGSVFVDRATVFCIQKDAASFFSRTKGEFSFGEIHPCNDSILFKAFDQVFGVLDEFVLVGESQSEEVFSSDLYNQVATKGLAAAAEGCIVTCPSGRAVNI